MEKPNGISQKRKQEDKQNEAFFSSLEKIEPKFKKPKVPLPKRSESNNSASSDDNLFKKPKLPERKNQSKEESMEMESKAAVSEPQNIEKSSSEFKYSTEMEKNKIFIRNVDFYCTEDEIKVFFRYFY